MLRFRDYIDKLNIVNDGTRSLMESIAIPEVERALKDWNKIDHSGILETVSGFKRTRNGAFQHNLTHVEIEVVSPSDINLSSELVKKVFDTAIVSNGVDIASPSALVALKLQRLKRHDIGYIVSMIEQER